LSFLEGSLMALGRMSRVLRHWQQHFVWPMIPAERRLGKS